MAARRFPDVQPGPSGCSDPAPLWAVLLLTFLGSLGSGAVASGIFFITESGLGYGRGMNLSLGAMLGVGYIAAALLAGPVVRRMAARSRWVTTRGVLACVLALMGLVCQLPFLTNAMAPTRLGAGVWVMVLVYMPATGVLWPIMESYLSGGRREHDLRKALGRFNIVWSSALVVAFWTMAPFLKHAPFAILTGLGVIHLAMAGMVFLFPAEPGRHAEHAQPHPPVYEALLALFRVLLFASYLVLSAVNPIQPILLDRIGVNDTWKMPIASVWLTARVVIFALFEQWHGWHGRWWTPWAGLGTLFIGFALMVISPIWGDASLASFILGLALMGAGAAVIYSGALYYAMEVGSAGVDAGGRHEAVVGMGYTIGPTLGLIALGLARGGNGTEDDPETFRVWTIILTGLAAGMAGLWGWRIARRGE